MQKEPPPFVWAAPDEKDILTCALTFHVTASELISSFFYREFYYRKNSHLVSSPRLTHPPLPLLFSSMAHKTPPSPAASTTAYSSSPQSTLSSHQVSRSVALCWRYGPTFISSARRCTPPQVVSNQIRRFVSPCLTSTLAPYVPSLSPVHR